jgi:RNA polymerase sigma factor for flagellar operon FliA
MVQHTENMDRLVETLAWRLLSRMPRDSGIEMSDLIQAGNVGLAQAARTFTSGQGTHLAGYAKFRIRGEMLDTVRRHSGRGSRLAMRRVEPEPGAGDFVETIPAPAHENPHGQLARAQSRAILGEEIARLPERDRSVVNLRYARGFNLRQIGEYLRVKESRACQLHRAAIARLRRALALRGVTEMGELI